MPGAYFPRDFSRLVGLMFVATALVSCEDQYRSQIGVVPGPDVVAEPDPEARARWTTTRIDDVSLHAVACGPDGQEALALGEGGVLVHVPVDGPPTLGPRAPAELGALIATRGGVIAVGRGAVYTAGADLGQWEREPLPRDDGLARAVAMGPGDTLWVAGRAPAGSTARGLTTVGWVARRKAGQWVERLVTDVPAVTQIVPHGAGALLVVEATPYLWSPDVTAAVGAVGTVGAVGAVGGLDGGAQADGDTRVASARGHDGVGTVEYFMPAQPDAHPPIAALAAMPGGFYAVGPNNAWRLQGKRLFRELRQLYMRLESVAALPGRRAVAVGRDDPPGGQSGGLALGRDAEGEWHRELLVPGTSLHAVTHCGARTIAVGDAGLIAIRRD